MELSPRIQEWMKDQIDKFQKKAFMNGRNNGLKSLRASLVLMGDEFFTKANILALLEDMIVEDKE